MGKKNRFKDWKKTAAGVSLAIALISSATLFSSTSVQASPLTASSAMTSSQKADAMINLAESLIGKVHYKWGVNDPKNLIFDCSSFTKYIYSTQGINLVWGAGKQASQGTHVDKANLQKGDLVHFSVGTSGKIGHVGIYMGNGKFIHNLKPGSDVLISDLNSSYWNNHYITATRFLDKLVGNAQASVATITNSGQAQTQASIPDKGQTSIADNGQTSNSDNGQTSNSDNGQTSNSDNGQTSNSDNGQTSNSDNGQTSNSDNGQTSNSDNGQTSNSVNGQTSNSVNGQTSNSDNGQTSNSDNGQTSNSDNDQQNN